MRTAGLGGFVDDVERQVAASARRFGEMPIEEMNTAQRAVNDRLVQYLNPKHTGSAIGGPMAALLRSPKLAEAVGEMVTTVFDDLSVPRTAAEVAILVTARHWNCDYEFDLHRRFAAKFGVDPAVVDAIENRARLELTGELGDVYDFSIQLLRDGDVEDEAFKRVADRWGQQGTVELIAIVGFYSMLALVLNVDRYPPPTGRMLPDLDPD
jgi:4-carboxymuconolactone decarboxylase